VKYKFIKENREAHSVAALCRVFRVSRSAFYIWCQRSVLRNEKEIRLLNQIEAVHERHRGHSGALKTWRVLKGNGVDCGKHRVARIRSENGIEAKRRRRFVVTTRSKPALRHAPNVLARNFSQSKPNQAWVGDVTYIPTRTGHVYLAVLLDLHSRLIVGWSISNRNDVVLIVQALKKAIAWRKPKEGLIHHSDRGGPYASRTYQHHLEQYGMTPSMSAKGNCWDNAVAESFFATLEFELQEGKAMKDRQEASNCVGEFIELFYNRQRAHQSLGYKTPIEIDAVA